LSFYRSLFSALRRFANLIAGWARCRGWRLVVNVPPPLRAFFATFSLCGGVRLVGEASSFGARTSHSGSAC